MRIVVTPTLPFRAFIRWSKAGLRAVSPSRVVSIGPDTGLGDSSYNTLPVP